MRLSAARLSVRKTRRVVTPQHVLHEGQSRLLEAISLRIGGGVVGAEYLIEVKLAEFSASRVFNRDTARVARGARDGFHASRDGTNPDARSDAPPVYFAYGVYVVRVRFVSEDARRGGRVVEVEGSGGRGKVRNSSG